MKTRILLMMLAVAMLSACGSSKQITQTTESTITKKVALRNKDDIKTLYLKAGIEAAYHAEINSAGIKITLMGTDSLAAVVTGPLGIVVGKLFATPDYFMFYNALESTLTEGTPTAQNLKRVALIPLSFTDLVKLLRGEVPGNPLVFKEEKSSTGGKVVFANKTLAGEVEKAEVDSRVMEMSHFSRNNKDNKGLLEVEYTDFAKFSSYNFAKKIVFTFPEVKGKLTLEVSDYKINDKVESPFRFKIPSGVERFTIK